jgi:hypothetical protein
MFSGVDARAMAHVKNGLYHDQYLMDMFFLLTIEVFGCLL